MRNDLTDLTIVLDRSGSMMSCREDAEGGVNSFIGDQKKQDGECLLSLVQFDTEYEFVHRGVGIVDVPHFTLQPRGGTALLDAVGRAINEAGERLSAMSEADRPGLVVFVIVTDGGENSSREFTKTQVKELIERQQNDYQWQFTFLGANQDAFQEGGGIGICRSGIANYSTANAGKTYAAASSSVGRMRSSAKSGEAVVNCFTEEERKSMA